MGFFDRLFGRSRAAGAAERQEADARKRADRREADAQGGADWQAADAREDASSRKDAAAPRERQPEAGEGAGPAGREKAGEPSTDQEAAPPVLRVGNIQGIGGREHQEDSFAVRNSSDLEGQRRQGLLAVVADGMGGMAGGAYASQCAVDTLTQRFADWEGEPPAPNWLYAGAFAAALSGQLLQCGNEPGGGFFRDGQRREQPYDIVPGGSGEEMLLEKQPFTQCLVAVFQFEPYHEPSSPVFLYRVYRLPARAQGVPEESSDLCSIFHEVLAFEDVEYGYRGCTCQMIASESGPEHPV